MRSYLNLFASICALALAGCGGPPKDLMQPTDNALKLRLGIKHLECRKHTLLKDRVVITNLDHKGECGGSQCSKKIYPGTDQPRLSNISQPRERRFEFFKLSLATTVMRGQPLKVSKEFESVVDSMAAFRTVSEPKQIHQVLFNLRSKIPNAEGTMRVVVDGAEYRLVTAWIDQEDLQNFNVTGVKVPEYGKDTALLLFTYSQKDIPLTPGELTKRLEGKSVTIRLAGFTPNAPSIESILERIGNDQTLIRMQQTTIRP